VARRIAWLVPAPLEGSGGHRTIFQNVAALVAAGFECDVYVERAPRRHPHPYDDGASAHALVERLFGPVPGTFFYGWDLAADYDLAFATAWFTCESLRDSPRVKRKGYFVQDFEPAFSPMNDDYLQAETTYRFGFDGVSIGGWLAHRLPTEFGMACSPTRFGADLSTYRDRGVERERAICFVYQPEKPRRCTAMGARALSIVKSERPDVRVIFYGSKVKHDVPFAVEHAGLLSLDECAALYARSQIGLCISATNPSRVPFEMMASGLPVVDIFGENNRYDYPAGTVGLAEPTAESLAHAMLGLLDDADERRTRSAAGIEFMRGRTLEAESRDFVAATERLLADARHAPMAVPDRLYIGRPIAAPADVAHSYRTNARLAEETFVAALPPGSTTRSLWSQSAARPATRLSLGAQVRRRIKRAYKAFRKDV